MSASGEGSNFVKTGNVDPSNVVQSSVAHSSSMSPAVIADMQRQVKENIALVRSLREELMSGQLAGSSLSQTSVFFSSRELTEGPLLSEESLVPLRTVFCYMHWT